MHHYVNNLNTKFLSTFTGADLVGGYRGCAPPPHLGGFLIQLVFCQKRCGLLVFISQLCHSLAVHPLLKEILDPPLFYFSNFLWIPS